MTNEEIIAKITEEATLRGLSIATEKEYQKSIRVFLRHYNNRPLEEMGEPEIRSFLLHLLEIGRKSGTVNIYNCGLRFTYGEVMERNLNYQMIPPPHPLGTSHYHVKSRNYKTVGNARELTRQGNFISVLRFGAEIVRADSSACTGY